ncbi:MAG: hypothetical protein K1X88_28705 [Nannocystaceae bacterium]|nr:hypothetical protein [Nannocystaceae bacterium]
MTGCAQGDRSSPPPIGEDVDTAPWNPAGGDDEGTSGAPPAMDDRPLVIAERTPAPITGGGVLLLADGDTVVVSDPDRDRLYVLSLGGTAVQTVPLVPGAHPWRAIEDAQGHVHVSLRGLGQVATIDPSTATVLASRDVCANPRGLAVAGDDATLLVACASGELQQLPLTDGSAELFASLPPDLRDVVVHDDGTIAVTRFRSAEVIELDAEGNQLQTRAPQAWYQTDGASADQTLRPAVAWRTVADGDGGLVMVHQGGSDRSVPVDAPDSAYGDAGKCSSIVHASATWFDRTGTRRAMGSVANVLLPVDVALRPDGGAIAIVGAGTCAVSCTATSLLQLPLVAFTTDTTIPCNEPIPVALSIAPDRELIAVAYAPDGDLLVQQRDPAQLFRIRNGELFDMWMLDMDAIEDTGHRLFHEGGISGLACASCHPEGGDDGLVWDLGAPRHTQSLQAGIAGTEPLHWEGDLDSFDALVDEVHAQRMGELRQSEERVAAFQNWIEAIDETPPRTDADTDVAAGAALFDQLGCASCHNGPALTNNQTVAVGDAEPVQVPGLHTVALHPPYMHDGRAATLADAVVDMIDRTAPDAGASASDVAQLVAYLETL